MEAKKSLASRLVARYHSDEEAETARRNFEGRRRDGEAADLPMIEIPTTDADIVSVVVSAYALGFSQTKIARRRPTSDRRR